MTAAYLHGTWTLKQQNGGPKELKMKVDDSGGISLSLSGDPIPSFQGAIFASQPNEDGEKPVLMSIYSTVANADMGLSITNYTGNLIDTNNMAGTAMGTIDYSTQTKENKADIDIFYWTAERVG